MSRFWPLFLTIAAETALVFSGGCSVGMTLNQPPCIDFHQFKLGESRMRVADLIGPPNSSTPQPPDNHLLDYHEFRSGTPGATRFRAIGYMVGDVLTLGFSEVVFWPLELTVARPRDFKGFFSYDNQEHVNGYRIVWGDGTVAQQEGTISH